MTKHQITMRLWYQHANVTCPWSALLKLKTMGPCLLWGNFMFQRRDMIKYLMFTWFTWYIHESALAKQNAACLISPFSTKVTLSMTLFDKAGHFSHNKIHIFEPNSWERLLERPTEAWAIDDQYTQCFMATFKPRVSKVFARMAACGEMNICGAAFDYDTGRGAYSIHFMNQATWAGQNLIEGRILARELDFGHAWFKPSQKLEVGTKILVDKVKRLLFLHVDSFLVDDENKKSFGKCSP